MNKGSFKKHMTRLLQMSKVDGDLYDATNGAFDLNEIEAYSNFYESYVSMLCNAMNLDEDIMYDWLDTRWGKCDPKEIDDFYNSIVSLYW